MTAKHIDFLIVGQGLAGSILAWELARRGRRFMLVERDHEKGCSKVAAGLVTPISGKRLTIHAKAREALPIAKRRYAEMTEGFGRTLFHDMPTLRILRDQDEARYFKRRLTDPAFESFMNPSPGREALAPFVVDRGTFGILQGGYLDTRALLESTRQWAEARDSLVTDSLDYGELEVGDDGVSWQGLQARKVIFCEGYHAAANPWFDWLQFEPAKGEILSLRLSGSPALPRAIVNRGIWLAPRADGTHLLGSTYEWSQLNEAATAQGREELLGRLPKLLKNTECQLEGHLAGVRPSTRDRAPFLGLHPKFPVLGIFNGFGARGSMLIPWYAERMAEFLCNGQPLPPEADIHRPQRNG